MTWETNAYYNPENIGLTTVAEFNAYEENYSFDLVVVWRDKKGNHWIASDSGCSCPSPFEDHTFPTDFAQVRNIQEVKSYVQANYPDNSYQRLQDPSAFYRAVQADLQGEHVPVAEVGMEVIDPSFPYNVWVVDAIGDGGVHLRSMMGDRFYSHPHAKWANAFRQGHLVLEGD